MRLKHTYVYTPIAHHGALPGPVAAVRGVARGKVQAGGAGKLV